MTRKDPALIRITLPAEDRERLGVPDVIDYDVEKPRLSDIRALREQVGITFTRLLDYLHGDAETADWLYAAGIVYWLAVRRAGVDVTWRDFDLDILGARLARPEPEEDEAPGNQPAPIPGA